MNRIKKILFILTALSIFATALSISDGAQAFGPTFRDVPAGSFTTASSVPASSVPASAIDGRVYPALRNPTLLAQPPYNITELPKNYNFNDRAFIIMNNCGHTVWPAIYDQNSMGAPGSGLTRVQLPPSKTGFRLNHGEVGYVIVGGLFQGRIWARTNCEKYGICQTGDCDDGALICKSTGKGPHTLAEFNLPGAHGYSYINLSLVDGYNIDMHIYGLWRKNQTGPIPSMEELMAQAGEQLYSKTWDSKRRRTKVCCSTRGLAKGWCPKGHEYTIDSLGNRVVAEKGHHPPCRSSCDLLDTDEACCRGLNNVPGNCTRPEFAAAVEPVCPDAYGWAYDDDTSLFNEPNHRIVDWGVTLCPDRPSTSYRHGEMGKPLVMLEWDQSRVNWAAALFSRSELPPLEEMTAQLTTAAASVRAVDFLLLFWTMFLAAWFL